MDVRPRPPGGPGRRHPAGRQAPVPAPAHRPRHGRGGGARRRQAGAAPHPRPAPAPRRPGRPGRPRHRAGAPRRGPRPGPALGRDRPPAPGPALLALSRPQDAARRGARLRHDPARPRSRPGPGGAGRARGDDDRRGRAAEPLHRQPARHDEARIRRARPEPRPPRPGGDRRDGARAGGQDPRPSPDRAGAEARPALPAPRRGADGAGAVQSPRQRRQIRAGGQPGADRGLAGGRRGRVADPRRGRGPPGGRRGADLRHLLPGEEERPGPGRDGPGPRDLPRLRRGDGRADHRPQPKRRSRSRLPGGRLHPDLPGAPRRPGGRRVSNDIRILVIDDEPPIRRLLRVGLGSQGYAVTEAPNGRTALDLLGREDFALAILDLGLPDIAGHDLLAQIRGLKPDLPVIVLSSRDDEAGKVEALDLGADDYVTKPFGMNELLARMRTALRHQLAVGGERPVFRAGDLSVDLVRRIVRVGEREVKLSPKEYDVLRLLVHHAGKVLTHAHLLREVWGSAADPHYLRVYVRQLRQKLEPEPERPRYILTETGVGYRMRAPE
ncbi:DNA-binding response regulator [Methylobacterium currus]|uniref:DNA-binding response regulator n=1 Tax=Methylobacterium currus TaxID=2051553 RepID=A0A2R4WT78_9HYPH|nr:DNA-binding response regulator [Methylobacterium currus]